MTRDSVTKRSAAVAETENSKSSEYGGYGGCISIPPPVPPLDPRKPFFFSVQGMEEAFFL